MLLCTAKARCSDSDSSQAARLASDASTELRCGWEPVDGFVQSDSSIWPDWRIRQALDVVGFSLLDHLEVRKARYVFSAVRKSTGQRAVIKILLSNSRGESRSAAARFRREARLHSALSHPKLSKAFAYGTIEGLHYIALDWAPGVDLKKRVLGSGPLPVREAVHCIREAAVALSYLHDRRIVHRDIKPANLILSETGDVKLIDLGLARTLRPVNTSLTLISQDALLGTPDFIAPEQAIDCTSVDARSDLYALGGTLYFLLTGRPPFRAQSIVGQLQAHRSLEPEPLEQICPHTPPAVARLCHRLLAKLPEQRPASATNLLRELERAGGM